MDNRVKRLQWIKENGDTWVAETVDGHLRVSGTLGLSNLSFKNKGGTWTTPMVGMARELAKEFAQKVHNKAVSKFLVEKGGE